ncbi:hypothetical protein UFOVP768_45 [uncultured Caudovirales phage]|uniref:Uncharacterized protein n=1 Tax=uncultured Caudovirales phage TaxID=2100421 RepID=A0A6J5LWS7_9CAUD|nr:hypothetical protein UFOVP320_17 [uncultured Caudovirales phage]CAB4161282.1 hypothetical protein UFOVP768_45 [uncultured Caudovirales phage]
MNPFAHFEDQFWHLKLSDNDAALHVFLAGWNSAMMEMMQRVNKMPFGDDTRASFAVYFQSQMVNVDAIEKPAQFDPSAGTQISKVWWDGEKLMAKPIPLENIYKEPEQPSQQEPFAWADLNALTAQFNSVNCGTAYRLSGEGRQPLYTSPPAQRKPLTDEEVVEVLGNLRESITGNVFLDFARAVEAAHGIKENT